MPVRRRRGIRGARGKLRAGAEARGRGAGLARGQAGRPGGSLAGGRDRRVHLRRLRRDRSEFRFASRSRRRSLTQTEFGASRRLQRPIDERDTELRFASVFRRLRASHVGRGGLADARRDRREVDLRPRRSEGPRLSRWLARAAALPARPLSHDVCQSTLDVAAIRGVLHRRRIQRVLSRQSRWRTEGAFHRVRSRHPSRL